MTKTQEQKALEKQTKQEKDIAQKTQRRERAAHPKGIHDVLDKLQFIFHISALSEADLKRASEMEWKDFEDAIQCATAERIGADCIITRNVRDFLQSRKVLTFTPAEFLERYF